MRFVGSRACEDARMLWAEIVVIDSVFLILCATGITSSLLSDVANSVLEDFALRTQPVGTPANAGAPEAFHQGIFGSHETGVT